MKKRMYKGSSKPNVKVFEPQLVDHSDVGKLKQSGIEADKVVWVSERREYALPFAMLFGKIKFSLNFYKDGTRDRITIKDLDYKEKIKFDDKLYLYELEDANYIDVYGPESISVEPVKVKNVEEFTVHEILRNYDVYVPTKWEIN